MRWRNVTPSTWVCAFLTYNSRPARRWFRKAYLLPAEHGSWSWLLVPYLVGVTVAPQWSFVSLLVLIGKLSVFLIRQPATVWLPIKQGRGRACWLATKRRPVENMKRHGFMEVGVELAAGVWLILSFQLF